MKPFTPDELNVIVSFYKHYSYAHIALMLGRDEVVVKHKALSLGLVKRRKRVSKVWSDYQVRLLTELYNQGELSVNMISKHVGKSIKSCYNKAHSLGLAKQKRWAAKLPNKKK